MFSLILSVQANKCPVLQCEPSNSTVQIGSSNWNCYNWANGDNVNDMKMQVKMCNSNDQMCDLSGDDVFYKFSPQTSIDLTGKKQDQWCAYQEAAWTSLHPGTRCLFSWQCKYGLDCRAGRCRGLPRNEQCFSKYDCDAGMQCMMTLRGRLSFTTGICFPYLKPGKECRWEDSDGVFREYHCQPGYKCAYTTSEYKSCYKLHSLKDGETSKDGDLCIGGQIQNDKCTTIQKVYAGNTNNELSYPYKCDLSSHSDCYVQLSDGSKKKFADCQCSLSEKNEAYCPFTGYTEYLSLNALFVQAADVSTQCYPDIIFNRVFHEWESCTNNLDKVLIYKKEYRKQQLNGIVQHELKNKTFGECFAQISPIRLNERTIYNTVEKLKESDVIQ